MVQKVFITQYALTRGIYEAEMEVILDDPKFKKKCVEKYNGNIPQVFFDDEFHLTKDEAIKHAEKMRSKKIESLKKQIAKLEKMSFDNEI